MILLRVRSNGASRTTPSTTTSASTSAPIDSSIRRWRHPKRLPTSARWLPPTRRPGRRDNAPLAHLRFENLAETPNGPVAGLPRLGVVSAGVIDLAGSADIPI